MRKLQGGRADADLHHVIVDYVSAMTRLPEGVSLKERMDLRKVLLPTHWPTDPFGNLRKTARLPPIIFALTAGSRYTAALKRGTHNAQ